MAKQTFTTGQVLTANQMTSLQQTAMGGGSATAKTANYVLVAADAGTTVAMDAAGGTTITVNTSLFAAGDTVLIMNIGAGTCTVTAGTATVSTAGSLALTQYESGILYFTATGTAIFNDYVQASSNPLTTTGDMIYSSSGSTQARLAIGSTSQVLTVASGVPSWATPASGGFTFQTWSPSYTNVTIGNGTVISRYGVSGKFVHFEYVLTFGSTTSFSGQPKFSLPLTPKNLTASGSATNLAVAGYMDHETRYFMGLGEIKAVNVEMIRYGVTGSQISRENVDATNPFSWGNLDSLFIVGNYEVE